MDPKNPDPLKHSDSKSPFGKDSGDGSTDSSDPHGSPSSSDSHPHSHDRSPHWDELGRGTSKVPKGAAEILSSYFDDRQIEKAGSYHSFFTNWRDLAGLDLAAHSRPRDIRNDTLLIDADHPGWVQMIYMKKASILKNIHHDFPQLKIRDIRVLYHPDGSFSDPATAPVSPKTSSRSIPSLPAERPISSNASKSSDSHKKRLDEALKKLGRHIEGE